MHGILAALRAHSQTSEKVQLDDQRVDMLMLILRAANDDRDDIDESQWMQIKLGLHARDADALNDFDLRLNIIGAQNKSSNINVGFSLHRFLSIKQNPNSQNADLDTDIQCAAQEVLFDMFSKLVMFDFMHRGALFTRPGELTLEHVKDRLRIKSIYVENFNIPLSEELYFIHILNAIITRMQKFGDNKAAFDRHAISAYRDELKLETGLLSQIDSADLVNYIEATVPQDAPNIMKIYAAMRYMIQFLFASNLNLQDDIKDFHKRSTQNSPLNVQAESREDVSLSSFSYRTLEKDSAALGLGLFSIPVATKLSKASLSEKEKCSRVDEVFFDKNRKLSSLVTNKKMLTKIMTFMSNLFLLFVEHTKPKIKKTATHQCSQKARQVGYSKVRAADVQPLFLRHKLPISPGLKRASRALDTNLDSTSLFSSSARAVRCA